MSKRKVQFQEQELGAEAKGSGSRRFKEKHSLDSDEEDDEKEEVMHEDDIEGKWLSSSVVDCSHFKRETLR